MFKLTVQKNKRITLWHSNFKSSWSLNFLLEPPGKYCFTICKAVGSLKICGGNTIDKRFFETYFHSISGLAWLLPSRRRHRLPCWLLRQGQVRRIQGRARFTSDRRAIGQLPHSHLGQQNWQAWSVFRGRAPPGFWSLWSNHRQGQSPAIWTSRKAAWIVYVLGP